MWAEAKRVLSSMNYIKGNSFTVVPSIKNWIMTIENAEHLINMLSQKYGLTSVWMRHLNQDPVENFFGCVRSHGHRNTSPTCAGFEAAFASLLVNNLTNHSTGSNCEPDTGKVFTSLKKIFFSATNETSNHKTSVNLGETEISITNIDIKMNDVKIRNQLEYVAGYVLRKLRIKIFKKCKKCNACFVSNEVEKNILNEREYFKNKRSLTYPSFFMLECFSIIQDIIHEMRKEYCNMSMYDIKNYIRTILSSIMKEYYKRIECAEHKENVIHFLENFTINFFLYSWCKETNKLLKGSKLDHDPEDCIQKMAIHYYKKNIKK